MKIHFLLLTVGLSLFAQRPPAPSQIQGVSGNGPIAVTSAGAQTPSACVVIDGNGNHVAGSCTTLVSMPNSSTGTVVNQIARFGGAGLTNAVASTSFASGIVVSGAGTTGNAQVAVAGPAMCNFTGGTTQGDWVGASTTTAGYCTDLGAQSVTGLMPLTLLVGRALSTNATAGTYMVNVQLGSTLVIPTIAGGVASTTRQILVDSNNNFHIFPGVDAVIATFPYATPPTTGQVFTATVAGGTITLTPLTGFSGTKVAGSCTFTLLDGYVTNVTGC